MKPDWQSIAAIALLALTAAIPLALILAAPVMR
jgi:hypothetical protein